MSKDFMAAFSRLMASNFERYAGCLIRIEGDKYIWENISYDSLEEAKGAIDKDLPLPANTIKKSPTEAGD